NSSYEGLVVNEEEYVWLGLVNEIKGSLNVTYNNETYEVQLNGYVNIETLEANVEILVLNNDKTIEIGVIYKNKVIYVNVNDMYVSYDLSQVEMTSTGSSDMSLDYTKIIEILEALVISSDEMLNISYSDIEIKDITLSNITIGIAKCEAREIVVDEAKYVTVETVLDIVKLVMDTENFMINVDTKVTYVYEGTLLEVTVLGNIYYENNEVMAKLSLNINDYIVEVIYKNNVVYITYEDAKIRLSIEEFMSLAEGVEAPEVTLPESEINIGMIFDILSKINITNNNGINITLSDILTGLSEVSITVINDSTSIAVSTNTFNYEDINVEYMNLVFNSSYEGLVVNEEEYVWLGVYLTIDIETTLEYDFINVQLNGNIYIDLVNRMVSLDATIIFNEKELLLNAILDSSLIYIDLDGIKFYGDIKELINIKLPESNTEIDLNEIVDNLVIVSNESLDITLNHLNISGVVLSNTSLSISKAEEQAIQYNKDEYVNDIATLLNNVVDAYDIVKEILDTKKLEATFGFVYENITIDGVAKVVFDSELIVNAILNVYYENHEFIVDVIYKDNIVYLSYNDLSIALSIDQVMDIVANFKDVNSSTESIDYEKYVNDLDIAKLLTDILVAEGSTIINLDLSDFIKSINELIISILTDGETISVSINKYDTNISVKPYTGDIILDTSLYVDLSNYTEAAQFIIDLINEKSIALDLNNINISSSSLNININGAIDINFSNGIEVLVNATLVYDDMDIDVKIVFINNNLYVTISNQTLVVDISEIDSFINEVMVRVNDIFGTNLEEVSMSSSTSSIEIDSIVDVINTLIIDTNMLSVSLDALVNSALKVTIAYILVENVLDIDLSGNYDDMIFTGNVSLTDSRNVVIYAPEENIISTDNLLQILDYVEAALKLKDKKEFNINLTSTINKNGDVVAIISGNVMVQLFDDNEFKAYLELEIIEYSKSVKTAWHQVQLTVLYQPSVETPMMYAIYGNNESDKTAVVKALSTISGIKDLLDSVMKLTGLDIFNSSFDSSSSSSYLDINNLIKEITINESMINLVINQAAFNKIMEGEKLFSVALTLNDSNISSIELNGIYASYTNEREYMKLQDTDIYLTDNAIGEIAAPSSTDGYIDISNISYLTEALVNNASEKMFTISGTVTMTALSLYDVDVPVKIDVLVDDNGIPIVHANIDMSSIGLLATAITSKKVVDIYYINSYVYIHRKDNNGKEYKIKIHIDTFMDDIMYYMLDYSLGLSDTILDSINNSSAEGDGFVDASKCVKSASIGTDTFSFVFDMVELADNSSLGDMEVTIKSSDVLVTDDNGNSEFKPMITSISKFKFNMVSVIDLKSSDLKLSNIAENSDGNLVVNDVDMSSLYTYVDDFNANFNVDEKYYYNGSWTSQGKITHSVIFNMAGITDNIVYQYAEGTYISFPEFEDDVVKVETEDGIKYYKILGWYKDKSYQNKVTETSILMGGKKLFYYAKLKDVTTNITVISEYNEDYLITTYEGASIEKEISSKYGVITTDTGVIKFNGLLLNDTTFDMSSVILGDYQVVVSWQVVDYDFVVLYGSEVYTLDVNSDDIVVTSSNKAVILVDGIYYLYDTSYLTTSVLLSTFSKYFMINDDLERLEFTLINPDYEYDEFESSDYNLITYTIGSSNFESKDYYGFYLTKESYDITSLLPKSTYSTFYINAWRDSNGTYYSLGDLKSINASLTLEAYISSNQTEFTFEVLSESDKTATLAGYNGTNSVIIFPRYVLLGTSYYLLTTLKETANETETISAFSYNESVVTVVFNDGLVSIGANAFKNCKNIRNVYFSETVTSVATDAFYMDYSSTFETIRDNTCKLLRFYSKDNCLSNTDWLACKWNSTKKYYGKKTTLLGSCDFTSAFQSFDGNIITIINSLV
ncbi:MAG: leucine-rich repeat protein, partial [Anaeroplasmataceae bacterium]